MKNLALVIILLFIIRVSFAQDTTLTEPINPYGLHQSTLEFLNKRFTNLKKNEKISRLEERFDTKIDNINSCLMLLTVAGDEYAMIDSSEVIGLEERLNMIADSMVAERTPILILNQGLNSVEYANKLNADTNRYNITYVSLGSSCTSYNKLEREGIALFNKRILQNLELDQWPIKQDAATIDNTKKKRKKKNSA